MKKYTKNTYLLKLSSQLKVNPEKILLFFISLLSLFVLFTKTGQCLVYLFITYLYPVYKSVLALESGKKEDNQKWLTYWLILGFFYSFNGVINKLLSYLFFPKLIKAAFFLYLHCSLTNGYIIVYEMLIRKVLKLYETKIDKYLQLIDEELKTKGKKLKQTIANEIINQAEKVKEE